MEEFAQQPQTSDFQPSQFEQQQQQQPMFSQEEIKNLTVQPQNEQQSQLASQFPDQDKQFAAGQMMAQYNPFQVSYKANIEIQVCDPVLKDFGINSFTVYYIKGKDKNGTFEVYRRYNEFFTIRAILLQRWPGCFVPSIPPKQFYGKNDKDLVWQRQRGLHCFCLQIAQNQHLYYTKEFYEDFLRSKEQDLTKYLSSVTRESAKQLVEKYNTVFSKLNGADINQELILKINNFQNYLKKAKITLSDLKTVVSRISDFQRTNNVYQSQLFDVILPNYEKTCLSEYVSGDDKKLIINSTTNNEKIIKIRSQVKQISQTNSFQYLEDMFACEARDCEAFLDIIQERNTIIEQAQTLEQKIRSQEDDLNKLQQGKKTLMSYVSNPEDVRKKLESQLQENKQEHEYLNKLNDLTLAIIGIIEIESFKQERAKLYKKVLHSLSCFENDTCGSISQLWDELYKFSSELIQK